jgi:hypothetical protein
MGLGLEYFGLYCTEKVAEYQKEQQLRKLGKLGRLRLTNLRD